ncbi:hypothetical protein ACHQM5_021677 [Ranunculus cassubicifolius]
MPEQSTNMVTEAKKKGVMAPATRGKIKANILEDIKKSVINIASKSGDNLRRESSGAAGADSSP